jgi:hypothetical protein
MSNVFIKPIDRAIAGKLADQAAAVVGEVLAGGYTVTRKAAKYDGKSVTVQLVITIAGVDLEKEQFERYAHLFDLTPEHYGRAFTSSWRNYTLVGIEPGRPKYPFVAVCAEDGKRYKFPMGLVQTIKAQEKK